MHILVVSYYWPPDVNARAFRWSAVTSAWCAAGHRVTVVTRAQPGESALSEQSGLVVHRVGGTAAGRVRGSLAAGSGGGMKALFGGTARAVYRATWRRLYWPDFAGAWYFPAVRAVRRLLAGGGVDALVTVSHPFTPHLVGLAARRQSPALRWVADCGDPFSLFDEIPLNNLALYRDLNRCAERRVLAAADSTAVTVESCRALYADAFPESAARVVVVPPVATMPTQVAEETAGRAAFAFFGRFYRALRSPAGLMALLDGLARRRGDVTLDIYGDLNDCAGMLASPPPALAGRIRLHGLVGAEEAAAAMARAGVLVNIGNTTAFQLPSKIFEYAAAGRPILNLAQIDADTSAAFLGGYPAALTLRDRGAPTADDIEALERWLSTVEPVPPEGVARLLAPHRPDAVAGAYLNLLDATAS
ncbi:MAG: glycosyltransferase [Acetobacterales bacterium]